MKSVIVLSALVFSGANVFCQSTEIGGSIILPPSPTPASLINQIDQSVQLYTGALNVGVPLYSLKSRSLDLPISLNYNGSGVKVNDLGSWVGLGWSLNAGGVVSRVMRGLPDEYNGNMDLKGRNLPAKGWLNPEVRGNSGLDLLDYFTSTNNNNRANVIEFSNKTGDYVYGGSNPSAWDTEPDEFYFSFGKYAGKFIFDKDGGIQIIPAQNLKITKIITPQNILGNPARSQEITSFEITDPAGIIYTFGNPNATTLATLTAVERTTHHYFTQNLLCGRNRLNSSPNPEIFINGQGSELFRIYKWFTRSTLLVDNKGVTNTWQYVENFLPFTSSWYLTNVSTPNGDDNMTFSYVNEDIKYMTSHTVDVKQDNLDIYQDNLQPLEEFKKYYGTFKRPTSNNTFVDEVGTTSTARPANPIGQVVIPFLPQNIIISTAYNTISGKRLSQISTAAGHKIDFVSNTLRYDLYGGHRLDRIDVTNSDNLLVKSIRFDYEYTLGRPLNEDLRYDQYQYWFPIRTITNQITWFPITEWGLDANPPVTPPAGELAIFNGDWLNNWTQMMDADYWRMFLGKITESYGSYSDVDTYKFNYNYDKILPRRLSYSQDQWGYFNTNSVGHTIPKMTYQTWWGENMGGSVWVDANPSTLLAIGSPNLAISFRQTNFWDTGTNEPFDPDQDRGADLAADLANAQAGILKEVIFPTGGKKKFTFELNRNNANAAVGGLRLVYSDDYPDKNTSQFERTQYQYFNGQPAYSSFKYNEVWDADPLNISSIRNGLTMSSKPLNYTPFTKGGVVGYARTEESRAGQGKKVSYFKNPTSNPNTIGEVRNFSNSICSTCPNYAPTTELDHVRGLLDKSEILNEAGKVLLRSTNTYEINPSGFTPKITYALKSGVKPQFNSGNPLDDKRQYASFYGYRYDFVSQKSQLIETYDQSDPGNELKKIITSTDFSYLRPGQSTVSTDLQPRKTTTALPNGAKLVSEVKYPTDYTVTNSASDFAAKGIFILQDKQVDNVPIESINYLERLDGANLIRELAGGTLIKFKEFPASSGKVYPWEIKKYKVGHGLVFSNYTWSSVDLDVFTYQTQYKNQLSYGTYDLNGNPTTMTGEDGLPMSYTWYNGSSLLTSATINPGSYQHQKVYTHKLLVGLSKITDPNAQDLKFEYDKFNQLRLGIDHQNNIQARYTYNFRNDRSNEVDFIYSTYSSTTSSNTLQFQNQGTGEEGSTFVWDFGDGTIKENGLNSELKSYNTPGNYVVKLATKHPEYPTAVTSKTIRILPVPSAQITSPTSGTSRTVCGVSPTTCSVAIGDGPYNYQWEYQYTANGTGNWQVFGTNSNTAVYNFVGVQSSSSSIRCKITDPAGNSRYSNYITIFHYCSGQPGGQNDCPSGWTWNARLGRCDPPAGNCGEGCFWNGSQCVCY